jgi:ATP-dependent DNA ligase
MAFIDKISSPRHIPRMSLPRVQPIIPVSRKDPFENPEWLFEFKYDGFRALCYIEPGRCRFISRLGNSMTRFDGLADQLAAGLGVENASWTKR